MTDDADPLAPQAAQLQRQGEETFGTHTFNSMINAVSRAGVRPDVLRNIVASPDALVNFTQLSQEALLLQMQQTSGPKDANFKAADETYSSIRQEQRDRWRNRRRRCCKLGITKTSAH
jgi:hypothetical protein